MTSREQAVGRSSSASDAQVMAAAAIGSTAAARALASDLARVGIPLMLLKGPPLQRRLFSTDLAYHSVDIDLLVRATDARRARRLLRAWGWQFFAGNGLLWRVDRAAAFQKGGVTVDLHWGIHAHAAGSRPLRRLEEDLWEEARLTPDGWLEPRIEPLLVYLVTHAAHHHYERPHWVSSIAAASRLVEDWDAVWATAGRADLTEVVEYGLALSQGAAAGEPPPLVARRWRNLVSLAVGDLRSRLSLEARRVLRRIPRGRRPN